MNFDFEISLNVLIGPREQFHIMECQVCGFDEVYFQHPFTKKQIGVACEGCNFIYTFDSDKVSKTIHSKSKTSTIRSALLRLWQSLNS
ncbi:hypothetical protein C8K15_12166 [Paenisporosarcina sp. OV554]|nr:hypothetical protein C8K15_12166 [Paenisporosarcina sp. OV554]